MIGVGCGDGRFQRALCLRVFPAQIDVTAARSRGQPGDGHAFDEHEGIAFHQHAIGEGT